MSQDKTNTRPEKAISLHPLTTSQALGAALRVKPSDLKVLEDKEKAERASKKNAKK